jgi:hypothetical protein
MSWDRVQQQKARQSEYQDTNDQGTSQYSSEYDMHEGHSEDRYGHDQYEQLYGQYPEDSFENNYYNEHPIHSSMRSGIRVRKRRSRYNKSGKSVKRRDIFYDDQYEPEYDRPIRPTGKTHKRHASKGKRRPRDRDSSYHRLQEEPYKKQSRQRSPRRPPKRTRTNRIRDSEDDGEAVDWD